jgi:hypothetical protein
MLRPPFRALLVLLPLACSGRPGPQRAEDVVDVAAASDSGEEAGADLGWRTTGLGGPATAADAAEPGPDDPPDAALAPADVVPVDGAVAPYAGPSGWREGYLLEPGMPDPWACRTDADCVCSILVAPDGCCTPSPHPFPQSRAYALWLAARLGGPACRGVECPPGPPPAPPLPCAFEARCIDGRCANACPARSSPVPAAVIPPPRPVSGGDYAGVVFDAADPQGAFVGESRWTPTPDDVREAERSLVVQLPELAASPAYQQERLARVVERLADYRRQYVGVRGEGGERVVWVHLVRDADRAHPDWRTRVVSVRGGGEAYVQLRVSLDTGRCFGLQINSPR